MYYYFPYFVDFLPFLPPRDGTAIGDAVSYFCEGVCVCVCVCVFLEPLSGGQGPAFVNVNV
jgi:hypothetical protein